MKYMDLKLGLCGMIAATLIFATSEPIRAVDVKLSGQINRAILWADDGTDSELFYVDNANSSTRIRVTGSEEIAGWGTVGYKGEWQFESNASDDAEINGLSSFSPNNFTARDIDIWFEGGYGKVSLGQGMTASDGSSEVDLSGTYVVINSNVVDMAGGISFLDPATKTALTTVDDTRDNFDGFGRTDRIRYDTTYLGPLTLSASAFAKNQKDVAARYSTQVGGFGKIAVAAAYVHGHLEPIGDVRYDQFSSSASWLYDSGFNVTIAYSMQLWDDPAKEDPVTIFVKLGLRKRKQAVSVHWTTTEDLELKGDKADTIGAGYVYNIIDGVQLYAGFNMYGLDREGISSIDDVTAVMAGARVKF